MYCVYKHRRKDNGQVFYIGIGKSKRPYEKKDRNNYWHNTVNKYGYYVDVIIDCLCWEDACNWEIYLIGIYGRKDLGRGQLVNMTDGGDGRHGAIASYETRVKISMAHIGKRKPNTSIAMKLRVKDKHPLYKKYGGDHTSAEPIVNMLTGEIVFLSAKDAANELNINYSTLKAKLQGINKNNLGLVYLKKFETNKINLT